jgi:hypothetical protein
MSLTDKVFSLDLDASLLSTSDRMDLFERLKLFSNPVNSHLRERLYYIDLIDVCDKPGKGIRSKMWGILRPHIFEFIDFLFEYCQSIMIWSAGQPKYVSAISNILFPFSGKQPKLVYSHDDCYEKKGDLYKPLEKAFSDPHGEGHFRPENTFHLDDRTDVISLDPKNGIHIPAYDPKFTPEGILEDDISLLQLKYWLLLPEVRASKDIRLLDKSTIFKVKLEVYHKMLSKLPKIIYPKKESLTDFDSLDLSE